MAKDPAFMFYASDFLTGTMYFTDAQVGKYMRLLCYQHQHGGLIDADLFAGIVGNDSILKKKFVETENGFYNERLAYQMQVRSKKSTNISNAAKETWSKRKGENTEQELPQLKRETLKPYIPEKSEGTHTDFATRIMNEEHELDRENIEVTAKKKLTVQMIKQFNAHCGTQSKVHSTFKDWKSHLSYWFAKQKEEIKTSTKYRELD